MGVCLRQVPLYLKACIIALIYNNLLFLHSPNAICYKIGEKICDQFNNGFILMVSRVISCITHFTLHVTAV